LRKKKFAVIAGDQLQFVAQKKAVDCLKFQNELRIISGSRWVNEF
jgi:hypothetical protein